MSDRLKLTINPESDGTAEVIAEVRAHGFRGLGSAWFRLTALEEFAGRIGTTYPLSRADSLEIRGGFWSRAFPPLLEQEHVGIEFYPIGSLGEIGCRVQLATESCGCDRPKQQCSVGVEFKTTYEALKTFSSSLVNLCRGGVGEAILEAAPD